MVIEINSNLKLANSKLKLNFMNLLTEYKYLDQIRAIYAAPQLYTLIAI